MITVNMIENYPASINSEVFKVEDALMQNIDQKRDTNTSRWGYVQGWITQDGEEDCMFASVP